MQHGKTRLTTQSATGQTPTTADPKLIAPPRQAVGEGMNAGKVVVILGATSVCEARLTRPGQLHGRLENLDDLYLLISIAGLRRFDDDSTRDFVVPGLLLCIERSPDIADRQAEDDAVEEVADVPDDRAAHG